MMGQRTSKRLVVFGVCLGLLVWGTRGSAFAQEESPGVEQRQAEAQAHVMAAEDFYGKGQVDEAVKQWREALQLDPSLAKAHHDLGLALRDQDHLAEATERLTH